jgi:protein-L-isoaspartate(D-aspartate) O-methyltransferase
VVDASRIIVIALACTGYGLVAPAQSLRNWEQLAAKMVEEEIVSAGVTDERVVRAIRQTPRHEFVPLKERSRAYWDMALPIGAGQTISPPFVVAYMTQELAAQPTDKVLEIGTGSGYQAAVLSRLAREVYSIEIVESLARRAARTLARLNYDNVHTRAGDGYLGWPEAAPFDKIIVTCSPESVPKPLIEQLAEGGRMVIPVGERYQQNLYLLRKEGSELKQESLRATLFVPMTGEAESKRRRQPDPQNPTIFNGSFEQVLEEKQPAGWHYQRQLELVENQEGTPHGDRFARFANLEAGRASRALQGFAVDGRHVSALRLTFWARANNIRFGLAHDQWPAIMVTFYDADRAILEHERVGPFDGSFSWRQQEATLPVPLQAREAILRIELFGAVGQLDIDDLRLAPQGK